MQTFEQAVQKIMQGQTLIYPTETFYALGCDAFNSLACIRVMACKVREKNKPLPVVIGSVQQLGLLTNWVCSGLESLIRIFWPGPLSVLVPALPGLPQEIQSDQGWLSVRWSSHPVAQKLCRIAGRPLVATSANLASAAPAASSEELAPALLQKADCFLDAKPLPAGGLPSTIVRIIGRNRLQVLRAGAVSHHELCEQGFILETDSGQ